MTSAVRFVGLLVAAVCCLAVGPLIGQAVASHWSASGRLRWEVPVLIGLCLGLSAFLQLPLFQSRRWRGLCLALFGILLGLAANAILMGPYSGFDNGTAVWVGAMVGFIVAGIYLMVTPDRRRALR